LTTSYKGEEGSKIRNLRVREFQIVIYNLWDTYKTQHLMIFDTPFLIESDFASG